MAAIEEKCSSRFLRISEPSTDADRMETNSFSLPEPKWSSPTIHSSPITLLPHRRRSSASSSILHQRAANSPAECNAAYRRLIARALGSSSPSKMTERPVARGRDLGSLTGLHPLPISNESSSSGQGQEDSDPPLDETDLRPSPESPRARASDSSTILSPVISWPSLQQ